MKVCLLLALCLIGVIGRTRECRADNRLNSCWHSLSDFDGYGFEVKQTINAAQVQSMTADSMLATREFPPDIPYPGQNYANEVPLLLERMQTIQTDDQYNEIKLFDSKTTINGSLMQVMLTQYGTKVEEQIFFGWALSTATYDAEVVAWKTKLANSRVRPPTVIAELLGDELIEVDGGKVIRAKDFSATIRTMPHSEWPSGSSCVCQALEELLDTIYPKFTLYTQSGEQSYTKDTLVIFPKTVQPIFTGTKVPNPSDTGYTSATLNQRCGETRQEGGMHFTTAVPDGRTLVQGLGTEVAEALISLLPDLANGGNMRSAMGHTGVCDLDSSSCTGLWELPDLPAGITIEDWRIDFFSLQATPFLASQPPYSNIGRDFAVLLSDVSTEFPSLNEHETILQARVENISISIYYYSVAVNSDDLLMLRFGVSKDAQEPIIRTGQVTTDARLLTMAHAKAAAIPYHVPQAVPDFEAGMINEMMNPHIGFMQSLFDACGDVEEGEWSADREDCLRNWYAADPSPARAGQVIAYDATYFRLRDGFNMKGTDGGCVGGEKYCPLYKDITGYNPNSGACTKEPIE